MQQRLLPACLLATLIVSASAAQAGTVTYSSFTGWSTALGGGTINTAAIPDVGSFDFFGTGDASVTYDGVVFFQSKLLSTASLFNFSKGITGLPAILTSQPATGIKSNNILTTLPFTVKAFAMLYGTSDGSTVNFALSSGDTFSFATAATGYATPNFFGVISTTAFDSVLVTSTDTALNIRDIKYGENANTGGQVPEPKAWCLLVSGLVTVFARIRCAHPAN